MGLREKLNGNPLVIGIAGLLLVAIAVWVVYRTVTDKGLTVEQPTKYFFTTDDGKTWFPAPMDSVPPFQVDGKAAVLCKVFTCDKGKTEFVGYLAKYTDTFATKARESLAKIKAEGKEAGADNPLVSPAAGMNMLVKKPGDAEWVPMVSPKASELMSLWCDSRDPWDLVEQYPKN